MTGQAKEDVLIPFAELGLRAEDGIVLFDVGAVREADWSTGRGVLEYLDVDGQVAGVEVDPGMLAFTAAGVPVRYRRAAGTGVARGAALGVGGGRVEVTRRDGSREVGRRHGLEPRGFPGAARAGRDGPGSDGGRVRLIGGVRRTL